MRPREVEILFGPTVVGKTTEVFMTVFRRDDESLFEKAGNTKWWCGYDGERNVLIDEFKGDSFGRIEEMNNMINSGTKIVETKGGSTVLQAERIFILRIHILLIGGQRMLATNSVGLMLAYRDWETDRKSVV